MRVLLVTCFVLSSFILVQCEKEDLYLNDKGSGSGDDADTDDTERAVSTYGPSIDDEKDGDENEVGSGGGIDTTEKPDLAGGRGGGRGGGSRSRGSGGRVNKRPDPEIEEESEEEEVTTTSTTLPPTTTTTTTTEAPRTTVPVDEESEEEEVGSGIDLDDKEGTTADTRTACQKAKDHALQTGLLGSTSPDCDNEGKFRPVQCKGSECFCVDVDSGKKAKSHTVKRNRKNKLPCSPHYVAPTEAPELPELPIKPEHGGKQENGREDSDDSNDIGEPGPRPEDKDKDDNEIDNEIRPSVKVPYTHEKGEYEATKKKDGDGNLLTKNPGIFAGIIGGAVVGLLILILLVMFIVYRMRKKDEGSYALDDQRKPPSHPYKKCPQEFYA